MELTDFGIFHGQGLEIESNRLKIVRKLTFEEWAAVGGQFLRSSESLNWWLGDWANYGVSRYGDRAHLARELADQLGIGSERLRYCMAVAEGVVTRVTTLSWTHHREVLGLKAKDQKRWLERAAVGDEGKPWSHTELRQAIRSDQAEFKPGEPPAILMSYAKPMGDVYRCLRREEAELTADLWDEEKRAAVRTCLGREIKYIHDFWVRLEAPCPGVEVGKKCPV